MSFEDRVLHGEEAEMNKYPWIVAVQYKEDGIRNLCGGSILNKNYVMTAAHCIPKNKNNIFIQVGGHNRSDLSSGSYIVYAKRVIIHKSYRTNTIPMFSYIRNDIALIHLSQELDFNENIKPICLPKPEMDKLEFGKVITAGWGRTVNGGDASDVLKEAELFTISNLRCILSFRYNPININRKNICVDNTDGHGACQGKIIVI